MSQQRTVSVGSFYWRFKNYGLMATLKYIFYYGKQLRSISLSGLLDPISFDQFAKKIGCNTKDIHASEKLVEMVIDEYKKSIAALGDSTKLKAVVRDHTISIRLLVISLLIQHFKPDIFIETGTQHGISAYLARKAMDKYSRNPLNRVVTLDVAKMTIPLSSKRIEYVILPTPVRSSFKRFTAELASTDSSLLFFHDSDHSYENMYFEIQWMLKSIKTNCLVSDDINGNSAFLDIASSIDKPYCVVKGEGEPAIGVILNV